MANPTIMYQSSQFFNSYAVGRIGNADNRYAQQFTAAADYTINKVAIATGDDGEAVPSATVYMSIQGTDENDEPDGNILASGSEVVSIPYNTYVQVDFAISLPVTFNQKYHIVVYAVSEVIFKLRGDYYPGVADGMRASTDGGSTWSGESGSSTMGHKLYGVIVAPVVTTDSAVYELYMGWEGWESIKTNVTLVQRICYNEKTLGFCYSTVNAIPTIADSAAKSYGYYSDGTELEKYAHFVTPGETYYVRAFCYYRTAYPPATYPDLVGYGEVIEVVIPGGEPEVTTQAVSNIDYDYAKGNGTIVSGENITERGFEVKLEFSGSLGDYVFHSVAGFDGDVDMQETVWVGTLVKTIHEENGFGLGAFTGDLARQPYPMFFDTLFECETYTCRAYMIANGVTYYGDYVAFKTTCRSVGHQDDNTPPIYIPPIIPPEEPIEDIIPPFEWPELPSVEMPDGYWSGMFYYRKAYTKKDLDELRRKCRIFLDNSVEYALVLNHNMRVLQQFLNYMHTYLGIDEFNGFKDLIPTQHLNALAHEELDVSDFKAIINNFISNSVNNTMNVNNNFRLIRNGLTDYTYTEDTGFIEEKVSTRRVRVNDPDVEMLKKKIDKLSREMAQNYATTQHNLYVTRAIIL